MIALKRDLNLQKTVHSCKSTINYSENTVIYYKCIWFVSFISLVIYTCVHINCVWVKVEVVRQNESSSVVNMWRTCPRTGHFRPAPAIRRRRIKYLHTYSSTILQVLLLTILCSLRKSSINVFIFL